MFLGPSAAGVIDQDVTILAAQMENIRCYGADFRDTPSDIIHRCVESLREAIVRGEDTFEAGIPESFNVLVKELQALGLSVELGSDEDDSIFAN